MKDPTGNSVAASLDTHMDLRQKNHQSGFKAGETVLFFDSFLSSSINTGLKRCGDTHGIQSLTYRINMKFISAAELKQNQL